MARYSGRYGTINGQKSVRNWNVAITNAVRTFRTGSTRGGTGRRPGVRDWTGAFGQLEPVPTVLAGDIFTFTGFIAPTTGVYGTAGPTRTGQAIVESNVITWDWENGEITSEINMACAGPLTSGTGTITDATFPSLYTTSNLWIHYSTTLTDTAATILANTNKFLNASKAVLTLTATNSNFVDSDTGGWHGRQRGVLDWTLDITQNDVDGETNLPVGTNVALVLPIDATNYWSLRFGQVTNYTGVTVDNESGNIISQTVNIGMLATDTAGSQVGAIRLPGASTDWWPWTT